MIGSYSQRVNLEEVCSMSLVDLSLSLMVLFFAKRSTNNCVLEFSACFRTLKKKKSGQESISRNFFCQTGKKAASAFSKVETESSSLGRIGADFAREKVLSYEIDDEEVI